MWYINTIRRLKSNDIYYSVNEPQKCEVKEAHTKNTLFHSLFI